MTHVFYEFNTQGEKLNWNSTAKITGDDETDYENVREKWRLEILRPYVQYLSEKQSSPRTRVVKIKFCGEPISVEFILDQTFLDTVLAAYCCYGWEVLRKLKVEAKGTLLPGAINFIDMTLLLMESLILNQLVKIENKLIELAKVRWTESREKISTWLKNLFRDVSNDGLGGGYTRDFEDAILKDKLIEKCTEYLGYLKRYEFYQSEIDKRNNIDRWNAQKRSKDGERTSSAKAMFEIWATPQRKVMERMSKLIQEIYGLCPPVVLILGKLPDDIDKASKSSLQRMKNRRVLGQLVYDNLVEMKSNLNSLLSSLNKSGQCETISNKLPTNLREPTLEGIEAKVLEAIFKAGNDDNRVLGNYGLVMLLLESVIEKNPISWERAVLERYLNSLKEENHIKKRDKEYWEKIWGWVNWVAAGLALLALLAFFPFGPEAVGVAPAVVTALFYIEVAAAALSFIVLLGDLISLFTVNQKIAEELKQKLIKINQENPEAFYELADVLKRVQIVRKAVTSDFLGSLAKIALSTKFKTITYALNIEGFIGDIQTFMQLPTVYNE